METKQRMKDFISENNYLDMETIAHLVGYHTSYLSEWLKNRVKSGHVEVTVERFLDGDGKRMQEITENLKSARKDRIALHQQRAEILKKARIHQTANQRVPSQTINN
jgi:hypothetical protein